MRLGKKNQRVTLEEFRPVIFVVMLVILASSLVLNNMEESKEPQRLYGIPVCSTDFGDKTFASVEELVEVGDRLYILPDGQNGFVQVYDLDGTYQYSMFFHENMNGCFSMKTDGNNLYVIDMQSRVYVFQNGEFQEYVKREEAKRRFGNLYIWNNPTTGYEFRSGDLWRVSGGEELLLIPGLVHFGADEAVIYVAVALTLGCLWLIAGFLKRRRTMH